MKIGRNDPCPCGPGSKTKRCCGVDAVRARAQLAAEAAGDLLALATHFPRYRPVGAAFDAWAEHAPAEPTSEAVKAGLATLDAAERRRIVDGFARDQPELWQSALADFGNDALAVELVLDGAVTAGVVERRRPLHSVLDLFEFEPELGDDAALALALALDPGDLWSVCETVIAGEELDDVPDDDVVFEAAAADEAARIATPRHADPLDALVERMLARLAPVT